jgi:hypothetical protein
MTTMYGAFKSAIFRYNKLQIRPGKHRLYYHEIDESYPYANAGHLELETDLFFSEV